MKFKTKYNWEQIQKQAEQRKPFDVHLLKATRTMTERTCCLAQKENGIEQQIRVEVLEGHFHQNQPLLGHVAVKAFAPL